MLLISYFIISQIKKISYLILWNFYGYKNKM